MTYSWNTTVDTVIGWKATTYTISHREGCCTKAVWYKYIICITSDGCMYSMYAYICTYVYTNSGHYPMLAQVNCIHCIYTTLPSVYVYYMNHGYLVYSVYIYMTLQPWPSEVCGTYTLRLCLGVYICPANFLWPRFLGHIYTEYTTQPRYILHMYVRMSLSLGRWH